MKDPSIKRKGTFVSHFALIRSVRLTREAHVKQTPVWAAVPSSLGLVFCPRTSVTQLAVLFEGAGTKVIPSSWSPGQRHTRRLVTHLRLQAALLTREVSDCQYPSMSGTALMAFPNSVGWNKGRTQGLKSQDPLHQTVCLCLWSQTKVWPLDMKT